MNKNNGVVKGENVRINDKGTIGTVVGPASYYLPGKWFDVLCSDGIVRMFNGENISLTGAK